MLMIDIPMPESCRDCSFEMYYMNCGETRCRVTSMVLADSYKAIPFEDRHPDCPLKEVVQCEDCKYYLPSESNKWDYCTCDEWFDGDGGYQWISPEGHCSYGIRREE